jgi:nucleoside-diphosphate-sugar epimerase
MKVALNRATQSLAAVYGFTVVWPRLFHIYGAFENPDRLIPYLIRSTLAQKPIKCQNPDLLLDFIDVRDLASALCELLDADISGAINLGSGSPIKIHDLAGMIMREVYGDSVEYPDIEMSTGGAAAALTPDLQRMTNELGFKPQISLREGIANTIAWWRENDS